VEMVLVTVRTTDVPIATLVDRVLLDVVDQLAARFSHLPHVVVYEKVGDARTVAHRLLPDLAAYGAAVEREAAHALTMHESAVGHAEVSPGTSGHSLG
jgi:hypothetical protein